MNRSTYQILSTNLILSITLNQSVLDTDIYKTPHYSVASALTYLESYAGITSY
jgi:hypothetical protein